MAVRHRRMPTRRGAVAGQSEWEVFAAEANARVGLEDPESEAGTATAARIAYLRSLCNDNPRVLEVGCGTGVNLIGIADRIAYGVGLDFVPAMIDHARELAQRSGARNLRFVDGDARFLGATPEADGPFELVLLAGVLEHLRERGGVLAACSRRLAPAGSVVVIMPHPTNPAFVWRRLVTGKRPRILPSDRHMRPGALARMARAHGLKSVAITSLPCLPSFADDPPRPAWIRRIFHLLGRIPTPATRGAYALILCHGD